MKHIRQQKSEDQRLKQRREKLLRRLKFYSTAASLGAFGCSAGAHAQIVYYDIPDVTISNSAGQAVSAFIDIHADGPGNPDGSAPEWQISAPAAQVQIRIDKTMTAGAAGDERADHSDIGGVAIPAPSTVQLGQGNQLLSIFGNPGSFNPNDPNPGYYVESFPAGTPISRATLSPTFYAGLAFRFGNYPPPAYNNVGTGKYVGLEWAFEGPNSTNRRYGWAQVDVTPVVGGTNDPGTATLTAYAIQMTPNTPIEAGRIPEPGSLALLAAGGGALALAARRRRN